jgi:DNA-binding IclR family transcriptional regulator
VRRAEGTDRHFVTALARGLDVLSCFRSGDRMLGNQEIAARCGLPKSTVSRLTYTLTKRGYLHYAENEGKYRLGTATLALGTAMLARYDVRQLLRPMMQELAEFADASVALATRDRISMIYLEVCRGHSALTLAVDVGTRIPMATTAVGRAYLALCSEDERRDVMTQLRELDEGSLSRVRAGVAEGIAQHQDLGCCTSFGDWQPDVNGIAVGFRPGHGLPPMAINCGGPAFNLSPEFLLESVRPRLLEIARCLESGHMAPSNGVASSVRG